MNLIDTHAHFEGSEEETLATLSRARLAGITDIVAVGGSDELNCGVKLAARVAKANQDISPIIHETQGWDYEEFKHDPKELDFSNCCAMGEIGLDYHYDSSSRKEQLDLFARNLEYANKLNLPLIIHTREADDDTIGILKEIPSRGVIHCFTGNAQFCRRLLDLGFYVSISGIVTFKNAENVREAARIIPDDRLLIETDAPFLAPVPMRGKENESSFIVHTAKFLADLRNTSLESLATITSQNAINCLW